MLSSEPLKGEEAEVGSLCVLHLLEVSDCKVPVQSEALAVLRHGLLEARELELDFALQLLGDSFADVGLKLPGVSYLETVGRQHCDLVDGVIDAVRLDERIIVLLPLFQLQAFSALEEDFIAVLKLVLLVLQEFHDACLFVCEVTFPAQLQSPAAFQNG